jgi:hypothetical protein
MLSKSQFVSNRKSSKVVYSAVQGRFRDEEECESQEVTVNMPKGNGLSLSLRHLREFGAVQRFQGHNTTLALSYPIDIWLGDSSSETKEEEAPETEVAPVKEKVAPVETEPKPTKSVDTNAKDNSSNWFKEVD